jgi:hypothetical protein
MAATCDFLSVQETLGYWAKQHADSDAAMTVMIALGGKSQQRLEWAMPGLGFVLRLRPDVLCVFNPHILHGTCQPADGEGPCGCGTKQFASAAYLSDALAACIWHLGAAGPPA